jgi:hypothetical protein
MKTKIILSTIIIAIILISSINSINALQGHMSNADTWNYHDYIETDIDTIYEFHDSGGDLGHFQVGDNTTIFRTGYYSTGGGSGCLIDLHVNENITKNIEYINIVNDRDLKNYNDFLTIKITYTNGKTETYKVNDCRGEDKGIKRTGTSLNIKNEDMRKENYYYKEFDLTNTII